MRAWARALATRESKKRASVLCLASLRGPRCAFLSRSRLAKVSPDNTDEPARRPSRRPAACAALTSRITVICVCCRRRGFSDNDSDRSIVGG